jgi:hypothetical protein
MMNTYVILVFLFLLGVIADVHAENRKFTNKEGKTVEGSVVSVSDTHTVIERAPDRKIFTIPLESLSSADNEFLASWRKENAEFKLSFEVVKQTDKPSTKEKPKDGGLLTKRSTSEESFLIKVTNLGKDATPPAQILFHNQMEVNGKARKPPPVRRTNLKETPPAKPEPDDALLNCEGVIGLPAIEAGKSVEVTTPSVVLIESKSTTFTEVDPQTGIGFSRSSTKKQTLVGLSFVVNHRDREVATWTTPGTDAKLVIFKTWLHSTEMRKLEPTRGK